MKSRHFGSLIFDCFRNQDEYLKDILYPMKEPEWVTKCKKLEVNPETSSFYQELE